MADKNKKFHQDFPLTQAIVESVCDPKEYGDKRKYPFINYLPFKEPSKQYIDIAVLMNKYPMKLPDPITIKLLRLQFDGLNLEQLNVIRDKSKCKVKELFIKDKYTNNIINAYVVQHEDASIKNGAIIDCHGGGYVLLNANFHFHFAEILSKLTKCVIILLNYKLAPEYPLPNAVNELIFLYKYILNEYEGGTPSTKIAMIGDSAGGGMVLLGLQSMKYGRHSMLKLPQPSCVWLNSPWVNITTDGLDKYKDSVLYTEDTPIWGLFMSDCAVGNNDGKGNIIAYNDKRNEIYSPQFGKFEGLSPMYFMVGATEIGLYDNDIEAAKKAYKAGVEVQFDIAPYMPHVWATSGDAYPEAMDSIKTAVQWILNHFNTNTTINSKL